MIEPVLIAYVTIQTRCISECMVALIALIKKRQRNQMTKQRKTNKLKSPLRYPGGKARLVKQILNFAPEAFTEYREPFLGGGSVLFGILSSRPDVICKATDNFEHLARFWVQLRYNSQDVKDKVEQLKKEHQNRDLFDFCRHFIEDFFADPIEKAAMYFILNRITFSGLTMSGGFSQAAHDTRFKKSHIDNLLTAGKVISKVHIEHGDYTKLLLDELETVYSGKVWIYCDPPYDIGSSTLYGNRGDQHKGFDHAKFAEDCKQCQHQLLVTYNDNANIRQLFSWANITEIPVTYNMNSNNKKKVELFITNY